MSVLLPIAQRSELASAVIIRLSFKCYSACGLRKEFIVLTNVPRTCHVPVSNRSLIGPSNNSLTSCSLIASHCFLTVGTGTGATAAVAAAAGCCCCS
eukprot:14350-Heterococcus_DN1.PRE.3